MQRWSLLSLLLLCHAHQDRPQITLMTYNVMLLPSILVLERDQVTRAHLLTKAKFLRSSDILCLQEVFQSQPADILLDALAETYPYSTPVLGHDEDHDEWDETWNDRLAAGPSKFVSGGVTILSKWPISYAAQYFYRHACSAHTFVRTGFVYSKILFGSNKDPLHVFGTHLQPNDYRGCYLDGEDRVREKQMTELSDFIRTRNISNDELVFILGDFNINKYHRRQYETMLRILDVYPQHLHPSSVPCSWDSSYNAMTNSRHDTQLLDYIFLRRGSHALDSAHWLNLITDRMASEQWHLLGREKLLYNTRNIPLMELSDHYPVIGFFSGNQQTWPKRTSGVLTYVQLVTAHTHMPVVILNRELRLDHSSNRTASTFILTNNGSPRRHRCLRSEQYILLLDRFQPEFYLSDETHLRMKYGREHANRYLKIIQLDPVSKCIGTNSTFILQTRQATGYFYIAEQSSRLCACKKDRQHAQVFRLIEVERHNISCTVTHEI